MGTKKRRSGTRIERSRPVAKKPDVIQAIFCNPPIAIARLGGSSTPAAAYAWAEPPNPRTDGNTVAVPQWSLAVLPDGTVDPFLPETLTLRDGDLIRPVCPFIELWARMGAAGSKPETWRDVPLTPEVLQHSGVTESALKFSIDARNAKAARRRRNPDLAYGTFPPVTIAGDQHAPVALNAVSPPGANPPMLARGSIPLGSVQVLRSRPQVPANSTPWASLINTEIIRLRFTPGQGLFYGPPQATEPTNESPIPAVDKGNDILDPKAGWYNQLGDVNPFVEPGDTFDETASGSRRSLGVVDDTCEARIEVTLTLRGPRRVLRAHANVFSSPPDFAPDRRPFLSLADELNDRGSDSALRNGALQGLDLDAWVEDLFERVYETVSLLNLDALHATRTIKLEGGRLAAKAIPGDAVKPPDRSMGSKDALRNRSLTVVPASQDIPLPISEHAHERHRELSDIEGLKALLATSPNRLRELVRGPFESEARETDSRTTMRMPPFMRQSNAMPLTLSCWQYELLMRWAKAAQAPAAVIPAAAKKAEKRPNTLSEPAARRRAILLQRLTRS
jgi:hypothetical protein